MSLELALQENTRAMLALTEILKNGLGAIVVSPEALEEQVLGERPKATKKAKKESEPQAEAPTAEIVEDKPAELVTRDQVSKALTQLASKKGRDAAMNVLRTYGASALGGVAADDYGKLLADCQEALS